MTAVFWSGQVAQHLSDAIAAHSQRRRHLNRVVEGEEVLTDAQRSQLSKTEARIGRQLEHLADGRTVTHKLSVVDVEAVGQDHLPPALREAYEQLHCSAYGSDPAVSIGDPVVIRGAGKRTTRSSTSQPEGQGGAAQPSTKKYGQSTRNVIKNRKAYELKIKVDRRLRRLSNEILTELAGDDPNKRVNVCSRCARIGEDDWRYCPSCGYEMKLEERE